MTIIYVMANIKSIKPISKLLRSSGKFKKLRRISCEKPMIHISAQCFYEIILAKEKLGTLFTYFINFANFECSGVKKKSLFWFGSLFLDSNFVFQSL